MSTQKERLQAYKDKRDPTYPFRVALQDAIKKVDSIKPEAGYTPIKGKDYYTPEEIDGVISYIQSKVKDGIDGDDGINGNNGKDGIDGKNGINGYSPVRTIDYWTTSDQENIIKDVLSKIPKPKDGITPDVNDVVNQVVDIIKKNPIETKDVKGLDDLIAFLKLGGFRGGGTTGGSSTGTAIHEYTTDPISPAAETAWVLYTAATGGGKLAFQFGGGMAITSPATGGSSYQLSYRTQEGTTIRTTLS